MDDLNLIREFRGHAAPAPAARERARAALRSAIAGRRARRSRLLVVAAGLAVLLVGGGTAYALAREFLIGDPAPADVKQEAARANSFGKPIIGPPLPQGPRVRPEGMVLAASLHSSVGGVYLWRAPSDREGDCLFTQIHGTEQPDGRPNLGGGCIGGGRPIDVSASGTRLRDGRWLSLVYGRVDESIQRLVLELDRRRLPVPLTGRFFLFELPEVVPGESPPLRFLGYDAAGRQMAEYEQPGSRASDHVCDLDISSERPALEILTRRTRKPLRAYVFEREGRRCQVLTTPGGSSSGGDAILRGPRDIPLGITQIGSADNALVLIWGVVGDAIDRLELHFDDGRVEQLPLANHVTLYQVDPGDYAQGRQPVKLVGRDAAGKVIAEQPLR